MNKIISPLKPGMQGAAVADLQDALLLLLDRGLIVMPPPPLVVAPPNWRGLLLQERSGPVYKDATGELVKLFREQSHLASGTDVDQPTADALNGALNSLAAAQAAWVVRGQVVDAGGPVNGIAVTAYDHDLAFTFNRAGRVNVIGSPLGTDTTKTNSDNGKAGLFEIPYTTAAFATGDRLVDGDPVPDLVFALSRNGAALDHFQVFRLPDGGELKEEALVSDDDLIMGLEARRVEEVRIVIDGGEAKRDLSEYEQLILAIEPLLPQRAPANADAAQREAAVGAALLLFDEAKFRDVSFVAREAGIDRFLVQTLVAAFRLALDPFAHALPVSVFYGLARTGAGSDALALARASTDDLRLELKKATEGTPALIPPLDPANPLEACVQKIRDVLAQRAASYQAAEGAPSLADLVGADLPNAADLATLWRSVSDHVGTPAEFWDKLVTEPGFGDAAKIATVKYRFELGMLTRNNIPLVEAIRAKHPGVVSTGDLAFELDTAEKWVALLDAAAVPIPNDVPGKPEEQKANYAASLAGAIQIAHPTVAVANMVATLPPVELGNNQPAVAKFLADAVRQADFDLVEGRINDLVTVHGETLLKDVAVKDRPAVIAQVKRLQRLFRLSAGPDSMKALVQAGFGSARDLADLPPAIAMDVLTPLLGEATAKVVLNRANNISAAAIHQYVFLHDALNSASPGGAI